MIHELVGIVEIGGPRGSDVPATSRQPLRLVQGVDNLVRLRVVDSSGAKAKADATAYNVKLTIRKQAPRGPAAVALLASPAPRVAENIWEWSIPAATLSAIASGSFVYDVVRVAISGGVIDSLVELSPAFLAPSAFSTVS